MTTTEFKDGGKTLKVFIDEKDLLCFEFSEYQKVRLTRSEVYELIGCLEINKNRVRE
jgi:hypothetical protein